LFQLFRTTMQDYIDRAWGWEELLQREGFVTGLPAREFQILEVEVGIKEVPVGCYHLSEKSDCLLLDMIMVEPQWQGQGYGRLMMERIQQISSGSRLPLRLRVLQTNPAVKFYQRFDFCEAGRDQHSLEMTWRARTSSRPD